MAYYNYKIVRDLLPTHIIEKQGEDYEGEPNYDGDLWCAAGDYINELRDVLREAKRLLPKSGHDDLKMRINRAINDA